MILGRSSLPEQKVEGFDVALVEQRFLEVPLQFFYLGMEELPE